MTAFALEASWDGLYCPLELLSSGHELFISRKDSWEPRAQNHLVCLLQTVLPLKFSLMCPFQCWVQVRTVGWPSVEESSQDQLSYVPCSTWGSSSIGCASAAHCLPVSCWRRTNAKLVVSVTCPAIFFVICTESCFLLLGIFFSCSSLTLSTRSIFPLGNACQSDCVVLSSGGWSSRAWTRCFV